MSSTNERLKEALTRGLSGSQLWSLLLDVLADRARERSPADLMQQWDTDRFVRPALVDQRTAIALDRELFDVAAAFEAIELGPLAPLGVCSVVAPTSQNRTVSTARGTEVISDPTNVLALECAKRLRADANAIVRLATSHRCVRAQPYPNRPGFAAHFRMFCLVSAGRERPNSDFTAAELCEHIRTHVAMLARLSEVGYSFGQRSVTLLSTPEREKLARRIGDQLPNLPMRYERLEHRYYAGLRFMINVGDGTGTSIPLIDGGCFDWVGQLTANRKFAYVASALGSQLVALAFRGT